MKMPAMAAAWVIVLLAGPGTARAQTEFTPALNECSRALSRQGYRLLGTDAMRRVTQGWRFEMRAADARGRATNGVCLVDERYSRATLSGFGSGNPLPAQVPYPGSGETMAEQFECSSDRQRYRECTLPAAGPVRLLRTASSAPCIEGQTWGRRSDRVWVDRGCRGVFAVTAVAAPATRPPAAASSTQARGEALCRNEAAKEQVTVRRVDPFVRRGAYLETTVEGKSGRDTLRFVCHYYPQQDRAQFVSSEAVSAASASASASASAAVDPNAVRAACTLTATRQGFRVEGQDSIQPDPDGARMSMYLRDKSGAVSQAQCRYLTASRRAEINLARPR